MTIILKKTGEEMKMGDTLYLRRNTAIGAAMIPIQLGPGSISKLSEMGVIEVHFDTPKPVEKAIKTIADINMDPQFYLDSFDKTPASEDLVQGGIEYMLLIHIAVLLDQRYERNIKESKEIYWCNPTNGRIEQLDKSKIKNFSKFPAFRTKEDAIAALKILAKVRKTVNANN